MKIFNDIEKLLFLGFFLQPIKIPLPNGKYLPLLLKSLTESEVDEINTSYFFIENPEVKFNYFIAYSFAQIEGRNLLSYRYSEDVIQESLSAIQIFPAEYIYSISAIMDRFRIDMEACYKALEAYIFTDRSRQKWDSYKGHLLNSPSVTGWEGTQYLRLSTIQEAWVSMNCLEDRREQYELLNDGFRLAGTAANPKGMDPVNKEEVKRRKLLEQKRKQLLLSYEESDKKSEHDFNQVTRADMTSKQLADELSRMQRGDKDLHDKVMEQYEVQMKTMFLEQKKEKAEMLKNKVEADKEERFTTGISYQSKIMDEAEMDRIYKDQLMRKEKVQKDLAEKAKNSEFAPHDLVVTSDKTLDKFSTMLGKLSDEEEDFIQADLLNEYLRDVESNSNRVSSPSLADLRSRKQVQPRKLPRRVPGKNKW